MGRLPSITSTPVSEESTAVTHPFLDLAPLSAAHFASVEDRVARLLSTEQDVVIMQGEALLPASTTGWLVLLGLAWISHCAGQGLIASSLAHLPAAFSSVSLLFQPVMAAIFAWLLLAEPLVPLQVAGALVVLAGIYLARRGSS